MELEECMVLRVNLEPPVKPDLQEVKDLLEYQEVQVQLDL